jgi:hypothetical protein
MNKLYTSLGAAALLALAACGSAEDDATANNVLTAEEPVLDTIPPADNPLLNADEANALGADVNATDANLAADANAADANAANTVNSQ